MKVPKLTHHKSSGKARVRIRGIDYYSGKWSTETAEVEYRRLVCEFMLTGRPPARKSDRTAPSISINGLLFSFLDHTERHYVKDGEQMAEVDSFKSAMKPLREMYGTTLADEFGPLALKAVREKYTEMSPVYGNSAASLSAA